MRVPALLCSLALGAGLLVGATAPAYAAPAKGDCVNLPTTGNPFDVRKPGKAVDCAKPHSGQIWRLTDYPKDWGKPSTETRVDDVDWQEKVCGYDRFEKWLSSGGAPKEMIPLRVQTKVAVPTDKEWRAGKSKVRCIAFALTGDFGKETLSTWKGTIPRLLATEAGVRFFADCAKRKPVSGSSDNAPFQCSKPKKQWIAVGFVPITGEPGDPYPGAALQSSADAKCSSMAKKFIVKSSRAKTKPLGIVLSKFLVETIGIKEAMCYVPLSTWNGRSKA